MQGCVLKNRLLNQTERSFDEREYGTDRFSDLVARLDVLLTVDHSETPYIVELREPFRSQIEPQEFTDSSERSQRIRSDLWHAIVDYSSTRGWVWDQLQGLAVDAKSSDVTADALWIPTLNELDLREWRAKFAEASSDRISEAETEDFDNWIRAGLALAAGSGTNCRGWPSTPSPQT